MKLILLVDDSKVVRMATEKALTRAGYAVVTGGDGEEALRIAQAASPDIIRLDMLLAKLSGPEVLRALKINPLTAAIPVIVSSGFSQENEAQLMRDGAAAYFEKSRWDVHQNPETRLELGTAALEVIAGSCSQ